MSKAPGLDTASTKVVLEVLQEVTDWGNATLNHTYLVDKGKGWVLGYRNAINNQIMIFSQPMKQFSKTKRKFKKVVDAELVRAYNT